MTDVLIRDVPDDVLAVIDNRAAGLGLSRSEYLRRQLSQEAARSQVVVTVADLERLAELTRDVEDPDVMEQAWS
ncbi:type II toxin-antitoxin system VapB family antitoxin [Kribbella jiaozuonensis]|uniref:Ribbon-helix-helix protein, CopG family n=1 Tax=Kribbella jiaozuonensis TaxID=2575441 RepID=A0A4U3LCA5_9ACTN|nr:ribbon-helix-helix protein, CopG family [Kribbella jiaozuonensis]TKK72822.1 ribbon-helix-helix protein, CopG family [Kribbella jiaozuonensis]TKK78502.1 ribbon-helix-helix protein, CopG family [Kribbella jiaozuonensis]